MQIRKRIYLFNAFLFDIRSFLQLLFEENASTNIVTDIM